MKKNEIEYRHSERLAESYCRIRHKSGLDIYVFPKKLSTVYALFAVKYGSADNRFRIKGEPEYTEVPDGIAHFLEHKMFENEDGSDAFERFAETGANANAYTSSQTTAYLFSCTEKWEKSLGILLDMVTHPHFTPESIEKEQEIIAQEIRMGEDSPSRALYYGMLQSMYKNNPIRINTAGTVESIRKIDCDLLYRCYHLFYNLHNMALVLCGDILPEDVIAQADFHLMKAEPFLTERKEEEEPQETVHARWKKKMPVAKSLFAIGIKDTDIPKDPSQRMRRQAVMDILNEILFSKSSEFRNALYEEGWIGASLSYGYGICERYAYNSISGESADPETVYDHLFAYIRRLQKEGVNSEEFERCRRVIYADCIASYDDTSEIAHAMLDMVFDEEELFEEPDIIASIRLEEINEALQKMFREDQAVMAVVEPAEIKEEQTEEEQEEEGL